MIFEKRNISRREKALLVLLYKTLYIKKLVVHI